MAFKANSWGKFPKDMGFSGSAGMKEVRFMARGGPVAPNQPAVKDFKQAKQAHPQGTGVTTKGNFRDGGKVAGEINISGEDLEHADRATSGPLRAERIKKVERAPYAGASVRDVGENIYRKQRRAGLSHEEASDAAQAVFDHYKARAYRKEDLLFKRGGKVSAAGALSAPVVTAPEPMGGRSMAMPRGKRGAMPMISTAPKFGRKT